MNRRHAIMALVLFVALLVIHSFFKPEQNGSTYSSDPSGTKALFLTFQQSKLSPSRWFYPFKKLTPKEQNAILFVIGPQQFAGTEELLKWVRQGNRLVLAEGDTSLASLRSQLEILESEENDWVLDLLGTNDKAVPVNCPSSTDLNQTCYKVNYISQPDTPPLIAPKGATALVGSNINSRAFYIPLGKGDVWFFSGQDPLINQNIDSFDNLRLFYQLSSLRSAVYFDEFHHGFTAPTTAETRTRWVALMLFLACLFFWLLVGTLSRFVRFGPPSPLAHHTHSTGVDFVTALGLLYSERKTTSVLRNYLAAWRKRLEHCAGISSKLNTRQLVEEMIYQGNIQEKEGPKLETALNSIEEAADFSNVDWRPTIETLESVVSKNSSKDEQECIA